MRAEQDNRTCYSFILFLFPPSLSLLHTHTLASKACHNFCVNIGVVLFTASSLSSDLTVQMRKDKKDIIKKVESMISKGH